MSTTTHFEIFLTPAPGTSARRSAVLEAVRSLSFLRPVAGDPARLIYYNTDTTVHFELILDERVINTTVLDPLELSEDPGHEVRARIRNQPGIWEEEEEEDDDEWDSGEDDGDETGRERQEERSSGAAQTPTVTVRIPLFRPSFFLAEAIHVLERLGTEAELRISRPVGEDIGDEALAPRSKAELLEDWHRDHLETLESTEDAPRLVTWSEERCRHFYDYAVSLGALENEFADEGLEVIRPQPAARVGTISTLCVWRTDCPAVLPQTDVVLLRHPGKRRLLLPPRIRESIVAWEDLEKILRPHAEFRSTPAPLWVVRTSTRQSPPLERELTHLAGEPAANTRRTELAGVIDIPLPGRQ